MQETIDGQPAQFPRKESPIDIFAKKYFLKKILSELDSTSSFDIENFCYTCPRKMDKKEIEIRSRSVGKRKRQ